ncbi:ECF RNA polymerase sigma factor SigD [Pseudobythopirellula maris]|uniref:ECF RNA polymerase sigma factor SigD n=1 Tax=Pseudobythopirellula maris TaxID=2527991 RepID=A0A5C5ZMY5_9BACT|nr:sigma-70 family RNA polymerase sigma factor [Pseudobythopirellula maris]TWT88854.1 ECF RNA polymerase sigma factor SigD [Pseudobythopirellula maris]
MPHALNPDALIVEEIRGGDHAVRQEAWGRLIGEYEGRLLAFVESRLRNRAASEDVVQETFIGFLNSLPNYDVRRPLESWLFSIAAHKLTDSMRREGRRPAVPLSSTANSSGGAWEPPGSARGASTIARSGERRCLEEEALADALVEILGRWRSKDDWQKVQCMELLFVRGVSNKEVADCLGLTEQQVANFKFDFLAGVKKLVRKQGLNEDVFPELGEDP